MCVIKCLLNPESHTHVTVGFPIECSCVRVPLCDVTIKQLTSAALVTCNNIIQTKINYWNWNWNALYLYIFISPLSQAIIDCEFNT